LQHAAGHQDLRRVLESDAGEAALEAVDAVERVVDHERISFQRDGAVDGARAGNAAADLVAIELERERLRHQNSSSRRKQVSVRNSVWMVDASPSHSAMPRRSASRTVSSPANTWASVVTGRRSIGWAVPRPTCARLPS